MVLSPVSLRLISETKADRRTVNHADQRLRRQDAVALREEFFHLAPVDAVIQHHADNVRAPAWLEEGVTTRQKASRTGPQTLGAEAQRPTRSSIRHFGAGPAGERLKATQPDDMRPTATIVVLHLDNA